MASVAEEFVVSGFPRLLWEALQLCKYDRRPVYYLHEHLIHGTKEYVAEVTILAKPGPEGRPYYFTGERVPSAALAIELVAREALTRLRLMLPEMEQRATTYLPFKETFGALSFTLDPIQEEPALTYETHFAAAGDQALNHMVEHYRKTRQDLHDLQCLTGYQKVGNRWVLKTPNEGASSSRSTPRPSAPAKMRTARDYIRQLAPLASQQPRNNSPPALDVPEIPQDDDNVEDYTPED